MDFKDQIKGLVDRVQRLKDNIQTEEATKNALIMPFIQCLGYDVFNPLEVVPEYVTDVGTKKGEKIDYAIIKDGQPIILVECKHCFQNLDCHDGQLLRYFHVSQAKFGILTNGIHYRFYTDLVEPNKMDEKPFFEFKVDDIKDAQIEKLKEFHKSYFDLESIINTASELKYMNEMRGIIHQEINDPGDDFTRYFARLVYPSVVTGRVLEQFKGYLKRTFNQYINDSINERLKSALSTEEKQNPEQASSPGGQPPSEPLPPQFEKGIITTQEELGAFYMIRALLRSSVPCKRIAYRDAQSYFAIFLDDNNRKPICRLYLHSEKKYIGTFDAEKKETRHEISSIDDILDYAGTIESVVAHYDGIAIGNV